MDLFTVISECKLGNEKAFRMLLDQYASTLRAVCKRYLRDDDVAKDALQETFIQIFKYIHTYNGEGNFENWAKKIAVNNCLKSLKSTIEIVEIDRALQLSNGEYSVLELMTADALIEIINNLPELQRIVFNMHVIEGFSHAEIAETLNISESNSKMSLMRAKNKLKLISSKEEYKFYQ